MKTKKENGYTLLTLISISLMMSIAFVIIAFLIKFFIPIKHIILINDIAQFISLVIGGGVFTFGVYVRVIKTFEREEAPLKSIVEDLHERLWCPILILTAIIVVFHFLANHITLFLRFEYLFFGSFKSISINGYLSILLSIIIFVASMFGWTAIEHSIIKSKVKKGIFKVNPKD